MDGLASLIGDRIKRIPGLVGRQLPTQEELDAQSRITDYYERTPSEIPLATRLSGQVQPSLPWIGQQTNQAGIEAPAVQPDDADFGTKLGRLAGLVTMGRGGIGAPDNQAILRLIQAAKAGDENAKMQIVQQYDRLIAKYARRLKPYAEGGIKSAPGEGLPASRIGEEGQVMSQLGAGANADLQSIGRTAILQSIDKYDPAKPSKRTGQPVTFGTFAGQNAKKDMLRATGQSQIVSPELRMRLKVSDMNRIETELTQAGIEPTDEAIAAQMGTKYGRTSPAYIRKLKEYRAQRQESIDQPTNVYGEGTEEMTVADTIPDPNVVMPDAAAEGKNTADIVKTIISKLPAKQQVVRELGGDYGRLSDPEVLRQYGFSDPRRAQQSAAKGLKRLQAELTKAGINPEEALGKIQQKPPKPEQTTQSIADQIRSRVKNPEMRNIADWRRKAREQEPPTEPGPQSVGAAANNYTTPLDDEQRFGLRGVNDIGSMEGGGSNYPRHLSDFGLSLDDLSSYQAAPPLPRSVSGGDMDLSSLYPQTKSGINEHEAFRNFIQQLAEKYGLGQSPGY